MGSFVAASGFIRWGGSVVAAACVHGVLLFGDMGIQPRSDRAAEPELQWIELQAPVARSEQPTEATAMAATAPSVATRTLARRAAHKRSARSMTRGQAVSEAEASPAEPSPASINSELGPALSHGEPDPAGLAAGDQASGDPLGGQSGLATGPGAGLVGVATLAAAHPPGLMALGDPCRGFYPSNANADHGEVRVVVRVGLDGNAAESHVVTEAPVQQGFASAARACVARLRFRPARDVRGNAVPGQAVLALSFDRS